MGIIVVGVFVAALIVGVVPGITGILLFRRLHNQQQRGTWPRYLLCSLAGMLALGGIAYLICPAPLSGAPTGADYLLGMISVVLGALAPGGGLVIGLLAALQEAED